MWGFQVRGVRVLKVWVSGFRVVGFGGLRFGVRGLGFKGLRF